MGGAGSTGSQDPFAKNQPVLLGLGGSARAEAVSSGMGAEQSSAVDKQRVIKDGRTISKSGSSEDDVAHKKQAPPGSAIIWGNFMGVSLDDQARARETGEQRERDFSLPIQGVLLKPNNVAEVRCWPLLS